LTAGAFIIGQLVSCNDNTSKTPASAPSADTKDSGVHLVVYPFTEERGPDEPLPSFDAYFTWSDYYTIGTDFNSVAYFWNANEVGKGRAGFQIILQRLTALPAGSCVLVYPRYSLRGPGDWPALYPFDNWVKELGNVAQQNNLKLVLSARDHLGNVLKTIRHADNP
jgi:hypothetical protein